jgi:hypothetical protein
MTTLFFIPAACLQPKIAIRNDEQEQDFIGESSQGNGG